jgi:uncharacterized protein YggT (Ycf19 family)
LDFDISPIVVMLLLAFADNVIKGILKNLIML